MIVIHRGWWLPALVALGLAATQVPASRAGTAAGTAPKPAAGPNRSPSGIRGRPMPDTVLAQVANDRVVTLSGFRSAWRQVEPPARPDSLTPEGARRFLDLLIGKEALGEAALRESWTWTDRESVEYRGLRDRLTIQVTYDSALAVHRRDLEARGDTALTPGSLGVAARESLAVHEGLTFDTDRLERLTRIFAAIPKPPSDSSLFAQLRILGTPPRVDTADYARPIARTREGPYTIGELMQGWLALSPVYRPRIERSQQLQDVIRNQLFERALRRAAERRRIAAWPEIAAELARKREYIAVTHLVGREVYEKIAMDSVTLQRYYDANVHYWDLPLRVSVSRLNLSTREAGMEMARRLADPAQAETLMVQARRSGVRFDEELTAERDSALFAHALQARPGAVLGPDPSGDGWQVLRVLAVEPPRVRSFHECRLLVSQRWYSVEGERLMVVLLDRCRKATRVSIHESAVQRLTLME